MSFSSFIAKRYFSESKKTFFVNLISKFALVMLAFGTCFQLIVFAGYNGLTTTLKDALSLFDPELKITSKDHLFFHLDSNQISTITQNENAELISRVIEGDIGMKYRDVQMVSKFMAVDDNFKTLNKIDTAIIHGEYDLYSKSKDFALVGLGLKNRLHIVLRASNPHQAVSLFYPNRNKRIKNSTSSFNRGLVYPKGIFSIEPRFDNTIILPYHLGERLTDHKEEYTSIHVKSSSGNVRTLKKEIEKALGPQHEVATRTEQRKSLYKALQTEELIVTIILVFLLLLCSLSVYLSILMTVISKKKDLILFKSWGASAKQIRQIILFQAFKLSVRGVLIGLTLGTSIIWIQTTYHVLTIDEYGNPFPVKSEIFDYLFAIGTTFVITFLMAFYPARRASRFKTNQL